MVRCRHSFSGGEGESAGDGLDHDQHEHRSAGDAPRSTAKRFALPGTKRAYERDRPFVITHISLDLRLSMDERSVAGITRLSVKRVTAGAESIALDAVAFDIEAVTIAGKSAPYDYDDTTLNVSVPTDADELSIEVRYRATPKRGLYFIAPDEHAPNKPRQVWSQCQDEDARHWFVCHDKPHLKQTTDLTVRAPRGMIALSNGRLVERREEGDETVFSFAQEQPHASYLVTLVVGDFAELEAEEPTRVPLTYLVPRGREADGKRTFARTPAMMKLFEERTGVPFAYAKYAQVVVSDFIFGGMENTSATTLYEHTLLDDRAAIDVDMDGLIAHELAHQWFGDLVTCRDFSEAWLNEGWATYMELVWKDEGTEPGAGRDEYDYALKSELDAYLDEDAHRYRRPIVCRDYEKPIALFDRHLYQKGALVLHRIRRLVGDAAFWRGVKRYLTAHAHGVVETRDFQRAIEAESGVSLDRTLDLYVFGGGHPALDVTVEVVRKGHHYETEVRVAQTQPLDDASRLYEGSLVVEIFAHSAQRHEVKLANARDTFTFTTDTRPEYVSIDPDGDLLAAIDVRAPADLLRGQLEKGSSARVRCVAASSMRRLDDERSTRALARALAREDEFWGVRSEAAVTLGEIRSDTALSALISTASSAHPKVRRAVAKGLGKFRLPAAARALEPLALGDASYQVQAEAARALGATRQTAVFDTLIALLDRPSWSDVVKSGAADGLAALRDERAVPHLSARTAYGQPTHARRSAVIALARLDTSRKTRELLEDRLDDREPSIRLNAVRALDILADPKSRGALSRRLERENDAVIRRRIRETLRDLRAAREAELRSVRDDLDRVRDEARELKTRLAKLEAKLDPARKPADAPPASKRPLAASDPPKKSSGDRKQRKKDTQKKS